MPTIMPADLQNIELLAGFQPDELEQFASSLESRDYSAGDVVFSVGDSSRSLFLILSGCVQIDLVGFTVEETKLAELGPQQVFGETTFFHPAVHNTNARCLEDSRLAVFPYAAYEALLKGRSAVAYHLGANAAHILAARLQATDQWIRDVLDLEAERHRHDLRERYWAAFRPSFETPRGYFGVGVNW